LGSCLTFKNLDCKQGSSKRICPFVAKSIKFEKYNLIVNGLNSGSSSIIGGEVTLNVEYKFIFWMNAYSSTDPTCSYSGTDCTSDGVLVGPSAEKTFTLTVGENTPPKGQYRGTAIFYNINPADTQKIEYASVSMEWNCDDNKCY